MESKTCDYKGIARIVGILYIIGTLAGALSAQFLKVKDMPDYLTQIAINPAYFLTGAVLTLVMGFALAMIPVFMFPILKQYSEAAAIGYVVFRGALETFTYIISAICYIALSSLGMAFAEAGTQETTYYLCTGEPLKAIIDTPVTAFVFGAGALILYTTLCKYRLIPRWISGFGIVGAMLHIASGALVLLGLQETFDAGSLAMNLPIAVQEMLMAVWLIIKGFQVTETNYRKDKHT